MIPDNANTGKEICLRKGEALPQTQAVETITLVWFRYSIDDLKGLRAKS